MKLDFYQPNLGISPQRQNLDWVSQSNNVDFCEQLQANTWVQLLELPSLFSFEEALLLCQISQDEWLVWIPDHGEAVINASYFKH